MPTLQKFFFVFLIVVATVPSGCKRPDVAIPASSPFFDSILTYAGQVYDSGYKAEALEMVRSVRNHSPELSIQDQINYFAYCGEIYRKDFNDYDKYIAYADSIVEVLEKNKVVKQLPARCIQSYEMKADGLLSKGMYNEAYEYYYRAKKLAEETRDSCSLSQYSYSLGMVLYRQQRYQAAATHFFESFNESNPCRAEFGFFYRRQELLDNLGLCYFHLGKYDSAMLFYNKTLQYVIANHSKFGKNESVFASARAVVYGNMADVFSELKQFDTSVKLLQQSIDINLQKGFANSDAVRDQAKLGSLLFELGRINELKPLLDRITVELDTIAESEVAISLNKLKWLYYDRVHNETEAYSYLKIFMQKEDSVEKKKNLAVTLDIDGVIKSLEKQYQISQLNKKSEDARIYVGLSSVFALLALVIVFLIFKNARESQKHVNGLKMLNHELQEKREKLQEALDELQSKDADKSRILRSAAHDVLNPIAAISGFTEILISEAENLNGEQMEMLKLIREACKNLTSLSKDILEAASTTEWTELPKEWVNMNKLIRNSIDLLVMRAAAKKQQIFFNANDENVEAFVNREKIWRVINNLVINAIKFSFENSTILINMEVQAGIIDISVADKGIGITEAKKPFVFNMFSEAKTQGTAGEVPHGLGLSISMQIARAHNGSIWFKSTEGRGSTFHLVFPANGIK